jgi:hypothetical protein
MEPVSDLRDTRVLIPRLRRALDGPQASSSASVASTLSDEQLNAIGADAIGSVIFYSGSLFGATLEVSERDPNYMSPTAWLTNPALSEPQVTVVVSQAALDYFFMLLSTKAGGQTQSLIADEASRWEWQTSPQAIVERLRQLRADRDRALEQLATEDEEADAEWVSFVNVRDAATSRLIEPWVELDRGVGGQSLGMG